MIKNLLSFIFIFSSLSVFAAEERTMGRSPRGLLMGDAFTSIADDEYSLFYNPALLARHTGFSFYPLNPSITVSNILSEPDRFNDIGNDPNDFAKVALGFPIHMGIDYAPGFKMGNFGLSAIVNYQSNLLLQNEVTPTLDIDHRFDRGFIFGYAHPLFGNYSSDGGGEHLALGVGIKYIQREAINRAFNLTGYTLLDALSATDATKILDNLGKINGSGWGVDLGLDYAVSSGAQTFTAGLAVLDLYTLLHTESNPDDLKVQDQPMQVNFGTSWSATLGGGFDFTLSADIKRLSEQVEFMRRVHLGIEVGISPALSVLAGLNAVDNYSYGVKFNTGLIKIFAGFYGTEIGEDLGQQESDRAVIYFSLLHFGFDP